MGWMKDALRELRAGRPAVVRPTGGPIRGRINRGDVITISPVEHRQVAADDVVLAKWKANPTLALVLRLNEGQVLIGDTLGGTLGWVPLDDVLGRVTDVQSLPEGALPKERKVQTITFGIDTPSDYGPETVLAALAVPPIDESDPEGQVARVLFMPSFHPEVCLTAYTRPSPQVVLVTMGTNLWYWGCFERQRVSGKWHPLQQTPAPPQRWEERADVPPDRWAGFVSELAATEPLALANTTNAGLDGMTVLGQYRDQTGRTSSFEHWVGGDNPRHLEFILALYRLADGLLRDERSVRVLENVYNYISTGLPLKQSDGPRYTLRIFGSLSSSEETRLAVAFDRVPPSVPLLMDMSNFDGMGTLLYPIFRKLLARPGPTVWWTSERARRHMAEIGVPPDRVFDTKERAVSALAVGG